MTVHLFFLHPQVPAPQSRGPSQLKEQNNPVQFGFCVIGTQESGWQQDAGMQSASV